MKLGFTTEQEQYRDEVSAWLGQQLSGPFKSIRGEKTLSRNMEKRVEWERALGEAGYGAIAYPKAYGGQDATLAQQVVFAEEYARQGGPGRVGHIGVELAGPTLLHFGSDAQKQRFVPDIAAGKTMWAQGYSEPNAGSDLSNIQTKARLENGKWIIDGQKIWTSFGQIADWIFVLARTDPESVGAKGLTFLLIPVKQPGIEIRPIRQITGEAEFNETFFDGAGTDEDMVVGGVGNGWRVAMGLLTFERGVGTLGQLMGFIHEFDQMIAKAKETGRDQDPLIRQRIGEAYSGLQVMRYSSLRLLSDDSEGGALKPEAMTYKLYWSAWHKKFTELCLDICGLPGFTAPDGDYKLDDLPTLFLGARADSIYGGTNQIQRNIVAERALGLPRGLRGS